MWSIKIQRGIKNVKRKRPFRLVGLQRKFSLPLSLFLHGVKSLRGTGVSRPIGEEGTKPSYKFSSLPSLRIILDYRPMSLLICRPFMARQWFSIETRPSSFFCCSFHDLRGSIIVILLCRKGKMIFQDPFWLRGLTRSPYGFDFRL